MSSLTNLASIGCVRWLIYTKTTNHATQKKFDKVGSSASNHSQTFGIFHLNAETFGEQLLYKRLNLSHSQNSTNCTIFLCSLDVRNIDDQCRGPSIKEKDHLVG